MPAASVNREDILDCCISDLNTMSDYSNLMGVICFYHSKGVMKMTVSIVHL